MCLFRKDEVLFIERLIAIVILKSEEINNDFHRQTI